MNSESRGSSHHRLRHVAGAFLCILLLAQVTPGAAGPEETKKELERAERRLDELTEELDAAKAHLDEIRAELAQATNRVAVLTSQIEGLRAARDEAHKGIRVAGREIEELQVRLNERAASIYIAGPAGALELVLEADSMADLTDRLSYLEALQRSDADAATGIEVQQEQLEEHQANLDEYIAEIKPLLQEAQGLQAELQAKQEAVQAAEADIEDKVAEADDLVASLKKKYEKELAARAARLAAAQAAASSSTNTGPPPQADGPLYYCPVDTPRSYVDDFGAPRVGHTHQGNDIFAPYGTPIRAPFEGTAEESSNTLGGLSVHVYSSNGSGDYVYNAHLSSYAGVDGNHVRPGDLIGYVGDSGNAQGTSPHDHFEYHPGGGSAVSPYVYLNEVCGVGGAG